jgi:hypothetical protein
MYKILWTCKKCVNLSKLRQIAAKIAANIAANCGHLVIICGAGLVYLQ